MIVKSYSTAKLNIIKNPYILLYGVNDGSKKIEINKLLKNIEKNKIFSYEEKDILDNENIFIENILSKSLFEP